MREHHIGIIVKDINKEIEMYSHLGYYPTSAIVYDELQNNRIVFLKKQDLSLLIELVQPVDSSSTVRHSSVGYHHICYEVDSKDEVKEMFRYKGVGVIFLREIRAIAIENRLISFAMLRNGTLIEFLYKS